MGEGRADQDKAFAPPRSSGGSVAMRSVERALARRQASYLDEVERLIAAGVRVMRRNGDFDPRVDEVLREAGFSNQVFYRHFVSKDEFLLAILDDGVRDLVGYLAHRMEDATTAALAVRCWLEGVLAQARDPAAAEATRPFVMPQARLAERFPVEIEASVAALSEPLRAAIEQGVRSGELLQADPERDARVLYELAMGWLQRSLLAPAGPADGSAEHLIAFALRGLRRSAADA